MFQYNLPLRYLIPVLLLVFSAITVVVGFLSGQNETMRSWRQSIEHDFVNRLHLSQHIFEEMMRGEDAGVIKPYMSALGMARNNRLAILADKSGVVVASTKLDFVGLKVNEIADLDETLRFSVFKVNQEKYIEYRENEGVVFGYIKICGAQTSNSIRRSDCGFFYQSIDASDEIKAARTTVIRQASLTAIGGFVTTILLASIMFHLITRRTEVLINVTNRFSEGDNEARTDLLGSDELACVGKALDSLFIRVNENQERLQASEASLARAQEMAHLGNWEWDIVNSRLVWSDEIFRIFGWKPQSFTPDYEHFINVIHPEDREKVQDAVARSLGDDACEYRVEHRVVLDDKTIRYVQEGGQVSRNDEGEAIGMIGTVLDITDRVKAEQELELFQLMIEYSADPAFLIDADDGYRMAYVNESAVKYFGATREEVLDWRMSDWSPGFRYDELPEHQLSTQVGMGKTIETTHKLSNGELVPVEVTISPVRYRGRNCYFGYFKDISERKAVENSLNKAKEQAEEAARTKSEFLANMSHEIRTPMNAIINLSGLAKDEKNLPEITREYLMNIEVSATHLLGVVNDILDFSKIDAGKLSIEKVPFSLYQVIDALSSVVASHNQKESVEVLFQVPGNVPDLLYGDPLRLTQILTNLLTNAIKFTDSGEVMLVVKSSDTNARHALVSLEVIDTGLGMTDEEQGNLFKPFTQGDSSISRRYGGTGLGLVITQRLVNLMNGSISVTSRKGIGSRFVVTLSLEKNLDYIVDSHSNLYPRLKGLRVLVVDDNPHARDIFSENFMSLGINADVVGNYDDFLHRLQGSYSAADVEEYDAVIIDWNIGGQSSAGRVCALRDELSGGEKTAPRVIICSLYNSGVSDVFGEMEFVDGILRKPFGPLSLANAIASAMGFTGIERGIAGSTLNKELMRMLEERRGTEILVVEDNEINQEIARQLLTKVGMRVTLTSLASEAFTAMETKGFDLILMDIQMPKMDGLEATRYIRRFERFANLPIIAMTAHALPSDRQKSLSAGMNDHLTKPINPPELYSAVCKWTSPKYQDDDRDINDLDGRKEEGEVVLHLSSEVDIERGVDRLGGNKELYERLLGKFGQRIKTISGKMVSAYNDDNDDVLESYVHEIKGTAGNLGIMPLYDMAKSLEESLRTSEDKMSTSARFDDFVLMLKSFVDRVGGGDRKEASPDKVETEYDTPKVIHLLDEMETSIDSDLGYAMDISDQLKQVLSATELNDQYLELEEHLSDFDLESVKKDIAEIKRIIAGSSL